MISRPPPPVEHRLDLATRVQRTLSARCMLSLACLGFAVTASGQTQEADAAKDARLGWWREARFGMFIHWGVYSAQAGEWHGEKIEGYAEHLQRIAKIPRQVYLDEVAKPFNPMSFNADEWVRDAKATGMSYIIITAMHHDGVAMYDSKVDDYSVTRTSRFGRDPLRELKDACDRQGVKFGIYYSHAVDWSLDGDPRYPQTNRQELRKAAVEQKVIPQLLEIIKNYQPALVWGDTPHLNPPELNTRILQELRQAGPQMILNGRLAVNEPGDYASTPDRPAEFRPMTGPNEHDWEAIPTTNESYGYHQHDHSHKPPGHFIRLLVRAAARGGNLLMNIGPKGDGTFAAEDQQILKFIGQWWAINGESIRGTQRTPLAPHSWGESTAKGNLLYLHVFDWPTDGRLIVGGLQSTVVRATLLADPGLELAQERLGPDLAIRLPATAPDSTASVIRLEFADSPKADPTYLLQTNTANALNVFNAELLPLPPAVPGWRIGKGTTLTSHVTGWTDRACIVRWPTRLAQRGEFDVSLHYDAPGENGLKQVDTIGGTVTTKSQDSFGGTFNVLIGNQTLKGEIRTQGMEVKLDLGRVVLEPGPVEIKVQAESITGQIQEST